jgi:hypothetical protein
MAISGPPDPVTTASNKGFSGGFVVKYSDSTNIAITSGNIEANGKLYTLSADTTHLMTSLAAGFDIHYIYLDDSESTAPTAVFYDSTTEPSYDHTRRGWYNGDDRLIGIVRSPAASATIQYFETKIVSEEYIEMDLGRQDVLALNMTPTGAWQEPNTANTSGLVPVNASSFKVAMNNADTAAEVGLYVATAEMAAANPALTAGLIEKFNYSNETSTTITTPFLALGASRNIKLGGQLDDANTLSMWLRGFGYRR